MSKETFVLFADVRFKNKNGNWSYATFEIDPEKHVSFVSSDVAKAADLKADPGSDLSSGDIKAQVKLDNDWLDLRESDDKDSLTVWWSELQGTTNNILSKWVAKHTRRTMIFSVDSESDTTERTNSDTTPPEDNV